MLIPNAQPQIINKLTTTNHTNIHIRPVEHPRGVCNQCGITTISIQRQSREPTSAAA